MFRSVGPARVLIAATVLAIAGVWTHQTAHAAASGSGARSAQIAVGDAHPELLLAGGDRRRHGHKHRSKHWGKAHGKHWGHRSPYRHPGYRPKARHSTVIIAPFAVAPRPVYRPYTYYAPPAYAPRSYVPAAPLAVTPIGPTFGTVDGRQCREVTYNVTVGGRLQQAYSTACLQPDGSWQIAGSR